MVDGKLVTTSLVYINLGIRILLGHSFYEDWEDQEMFVTQDPLGNPVDRRHPWNQHTTAAPLHGLATTPSHPPIPGDKPGAETLESLP